MTRWSFGLRQLFLLVSAIALGLVALRSAATPWVSAMLALTVMVLTVSLLLLIFRRGPQRAYWIGFATCGWMYLLLLLLSWTLGRNTSNDSPLRARNLVTQQLSTGVYHWLYEKAFERHLVSIPDGGTVFLGSSGGGYVGSGVMPGAAGDSGMALGSGDMMSSDGMSTRLGMGDRFRAPAQPPGPNEGDFVNVAHSLWTLLFASIGGWLALWLYATGPGRTEKADRGQSGG